MWNKTRMFFKKYNTCPSYPCLCRFVHVELTANQVSLMGKHLSFLLYHSWVYAVQFQEIISLLPFKFCNFILHLIYGFLLSLPLLDAFWIKSHFLLAFSQILPCNMWHTCTVHRSRPFIDVGATLIGNCICYHWICFYFFQVASLYCLESRIC